MSPFTTTYGVSTAVKSIDISTFLSGATTNPTPNLTSSYARFQQIGSFITIQFKYVFATTGSTGAISINLPLPINSSYPKANGYTEIRYNNSGGFTHNLLVNENTASNITLTGQTSYSSIPTSFTNLIPNSGLTAGDIFSGVIFYETT